MIIAIATNSMDKIDGITMAFKRFFQIGDAELGVVHCSVDSDVPEQPFNDETYLGAVNRVNYLIPSIYADYYVSCEAGIECFLDNYFNVQVICIYDNKNKKYYYGKSSGWQVPTTDITEVKSIGLDKYLRNKGYTCLEDVLGLDYSRAYTIMQATEHALCTILLHN